jgi:Xaa-Pro aminopeptidase
LRFILKGDQLKRLETIKEKMVTGNKKDGVLVLNSANLLYLTGLPGSSALLISKDRDCVIFSHDVNYGYLKKKAKDFTVVRVKPSENILKKIVKKAKTYEIKNLILDSATIETWNALSKISDNSIKLGVDRKIIQDMRKIKTKEEIKQLRKAADLTIKGMQVAAQVISPGIKESQVAAEVEYVIRKHDCSGMAFETIVASGKGSAFPHGSSSSKEICRGDIVVVDVGAKYNFYCSDMTRTFAVGPSSEKQKRIFQIIKKSQREALKTLRDCVDAKYVDNIARKIIEKEGYGEYFVHNLGHGVGLEVHEQPILGSRSKDKVMAGNVITVEPGIYLIDYGGVRIEDTVLVKKDGIEKLTDGIHNFELE